MPWNWLARLLAPRQPSFAEMREQFLRRRADLEQAFFQAASSSGKPRGLRWKSIEWQPGVEFAREVKSGQLAGLVGVTIAFEAIEGGDMEGVAAVGNLRQASAVFFYHKGTWLTTGRTIFNLGPEEAIAHFGAQYERMTGSG